MLFYNARVFTASSDTIENGFVQTKGGVIIDVGPMAVAPRDDEGYDMAGALLTPGFIDAHCHIGMWEDGMGIEGDDGNEDTDPCTPQLRAVDAVNPVERAFSDARNAGVTTVVTGPGSGNPISGQLMAMKTAGSRVDDMVLRSPLGMKFAMGENPKNTYHAKGETPATRMATAALIREQLLRAMHYLADLQDAEEDPERDRPEFDMKCEALTGVLEGSMQAHFHAHRLDDIFTAIRIAKEFGLKLVLIHGTEGYLAAETLAGERVPVIAGPMLTSRTKPELCRQSAEGPALLSKAGVKVAICTDHPEVPINYLALSAGAAVGAGMEHDEALRAITLYPAQICGLDDRVGSIAPGKDADFAVFSGDPLSVFTGPEWVVCGGRIIKRPG